MRDRRKILMSILAGLLGLVAVVIFMGMAKVGKGKRIP